MGAYGHILQRLSVDLLRWLRPPSVRVPTNPTLTVLVGCVSMLPLSTYPQCLLFSLRRCWLVRFVYLRRQTSGIWIRLVCETLCVLDARKERSAIGSCSSGGQASHLSLSVLNSSQHTFSAFIRCLVPRTCVRCARFSPAQHDMAPAVGTGFRT